MNVYVVWLHSVENCDDEVHAVVVAETEEDAIKSAEDGCALNVDPSLTECDLVDEDCPCIIWLE
jgi:hypothetical protein